MRKSFTADAQSVRMGVHMATAIERVTQSALPLIQVKILATLATKATDANGYAALELAGYDVDAIDDAIEALHHAGLLNAFFVNQAARPRYHPSSLTREGRRVCEQHVRSSGS